MFNSHEHTNYIDIFHNIVYCTNMSFPRAEVSQTEARNINKYEHLVEEQKQMCRLRYIKERPIIILVTG